MDGDELRSVFGYKLFSKEKRLAFGMSYSRLCRLLVKQEINVVIGVIALFKEIHTWNRENIENYNEIYIKVPMKVLVARDQKKLYSLALKGEVKHVMGVDIKVEEPNNPDIIINNDGSNTPEEMMNEIIEKLGLNRKLIS